MSSSFSLCLLLFLLLCVSLCVDPVSGGCTSQNSSSESNFNAYSIPSGDWVWFSAVFTPPSISNPTLITVTHEVLNLESGNILSFPSANILYYPSSSTITPSVAFDSVNNVWNIVTRDGLSGNSFFGGFAYHATSGLPGSLTPTWSVTVTANATQIDVPWQWSAAVYSNFTNSYNLLGVKPEDDNSAGPYLNSDHAGTPENYKTHVVAGGTGGGGSNYCGSYSGTFTIHCRPPSSSSSTGPSGRSSSSSSSSTGPSVVGDPQFVGFLGQSYQIHGIDGAVYSIISDAYVQVNALFVFLESGQCPPANVHRASACWSHPGSYFGSVAIQTLNGDKLLIKSGVAALGFNKVVWNGVNQRIQQQASSADNLLSFNYTSSHVITVTFGLYTAVIENSDQFVNIQKMVIDDWDVLTHSVRSHGLLGQTWRRPKKELALQVKDIEGMVDDYVQPDNDLFSYHDLYTQFKPIHRK